MTAGVSTAVASTAISKKPATTEMAHSAPLVFIDTNGPCAVSITPKMTSTSVPPT